MAVEAWVVLTVLGALGAERAFELYLNRRHVGWLRDNGAVFVGQDGFFLILFAQVLLFAGLAGEALLAPWTRLGWWTWVGLSLALLAQVLRYWVIRTLGARWSIRVVTLPGAARITGGPYRWLKHPNYLAVALEAFALPLAFMAWGTMLVALPVQLAALAWRIRIEERALSGSSGTARKPAHG